MNSVQPPFVSVKIIGGRHRRHLHSLRPIGRPQRRMEAPKEIRLLTLREGYARSTQVVWKRGRPVGLNVSLVQPAEPIADPMMASIKKAWATERA